MENKIKQILKKHNCLTNEEIDDISKELKQLYLKQLYNDDDLIFTVLTKLVENRPLEWREGQAWFNFAYMLFPDVVSLISETKDDCFYNDNRIDDFIVKLKCLTNGKINDFIIRYIN